MKEKLKYIVVAWFFFMCFDSFAQNDWDKREAVGGSKRERGIGFAIGSRGYIGLGQDTSNQMLNDFWEFDPGTNSWTQKATFPGQARRDAVGFSIGSKGYVGTGVTNATSYLGSKLTDFWEYSPATNSWLARASIPTPGRYYSTGFSVNGKGYICCGKLSGSTYTTQLLEYNPAVNSWAQKAPFPGGVRYGGVAFVVGDNAYYGTGAEENYFMRDFYKYNPATNQWTAISSFPGSERFSCSSFTLKSKGYILFGGDGGYKDEVWEYDPAADYWSVKAPFPGGARRSSVAFTIGSRAYAGTGKGNTGTRRDFWEYSPSVPIGMEENSMNSITSVYPNPLVDKARVVLSSETVSDKKELEWELVNLQGKLVQSGKVTVVTFTIERNEIPPGIYFLNLSSQGKSIAMKKIIVQ